jgi:multidrug efflux pump subunit AcrB
VKLITFFLKSRTGANVVMLLIVGLGVLALTRLQRETFPSSDMDMLRVTARYEGASPEEVERTVLNLIEEECIGITGFKSVSGTATEGRAIVIVELVEGTDRGATLIDLRDRIGQIKGFPAGVDEVVVSEVTRRDSVATLVISGDVPEAVLKHHAERFRDALITTRVATEVDLESVRAPEIRIALSESLLRKHNLSIASVAAAIRATSLNLPLGSIHAPRGDYLLRIREERRHPREFLNIPVGRGTDGREIFLGTIAEVTRGFEEVEVGARYNGKRAVIVQVNKTGDQDTIAVAAGVESYVQAFRRQLPPGLDISIFTNQSRKIRDRLTLLVKNGAMGLVLVFLVLWFFTEVRVAFWVSWGIPVSFLGTLFVMYLLGLTLNMITMFGLLLVLGMIVDDAVVVSENIFTRFRKGEKAFDAAANGTKEVLWPTIASSLTTIGAFIPLMFVSGRMGRTMGALPWVIIAALLVSLIESFICLPKHLQHAMPRLEGGRPKRNRVRAAIEGWLDSFVERVVGPVSVRLLRWRYWVLGGAALALLASAGLLLGGRLGFTFFPTPDTNSIVARVRYPLGTGAATSTQMVSELEAALKKVEAKLGSPEKPLIERVLVRFGETSLDTDKGGHLAQVQVELRDAEHRSVTSDEVLAAWEQLCAVRPGVASLSFARLEKGVGGKELDIRLVGNSWKQLKAAAGYLKRELSSVPGVSSIEMDLRPGKREMTLRVNPEGSRLGLTAAALAGQVRAAFFGVVVQRFHQHGDETTVRVLYPEGARRSIDDLRNLTITLSGAGGEALRVPLLRVASVEHGRGWAELNHLDRQRAVALTGKVDERMTTAGKVIRALGPALTTEIPKKFPGVQVKLEGQRATQAETFKSLQFGAVIGLLVVFAVLILVMDSWGTPLLVLSLVPMGIVGMLLGHLLMGYNLIMLSVMAGVAMGGVVINDAIILVDFFKQERSRTGDFHEALVSAVKRRFRPIVITTITTVAGLLPMLIETSIQAQFLIPMAITIAFGLMTGTLGTLVVLPSLMQVVEDARSLFSGGQQSAAKQN